MVKIVLDSSYAYTKVEIQKLVHAVSFYVHVTDVRKPSFSCQVTYNCTVIISTTCRNLLLNCYLHYTPINATSYNIVNPDSDRLNLKSKDHSYVIYQIKHMYMNACTRNTVSI